MKNKFIKFNKYLFIYYLLWMFCDVLGSERMLDSEHLQQISSLLRFGFFVWGYLYWEAVNDNIEALHNKVKSVRRDLQFMYDDLISDDKPPKPCNDDEEIKDWPI